MLLLQRGGSFSATKTMFWVALMLVFAQVAHAFDACATHLEDTRQDITILKAPCSAGHNCEFCAPTPPEDICDAVSELAIVISAGAYLIAPPVIILDAPFVTSPIPSLEESKDAPLSRHSSDVPPLRSQYLAPQLSGRAPPFSL